MRSRDLKVTLIAAAGLLALANPGCNCGNRPGPINPPPVDPATTGAKVKCSCDVFVSGDAQTFGGLPEKSTIPFDACLPASHAGQENTFCQDVGGHFLTNAAEQIALKFKPDFVPEQAVCGGFATFPIPRSYSPAISRVVCTAQPFFGPGGPLVIEETQCKDASGGPKACEAIECTLTSDGSLSDGNCLVQANNIIFDRCNCTVAKGCDNERSAAVCVVKPGGASTTQPLTTSPMTVVTSRLSAAAVDRTVSKLDINVEVELFCTPLGCATVSDDAHPAASGVVNIFGGPCPGGTCNIRMDGQLAVDNFTLGFSAGPFSETHNMSDVTIRFGAGDTELTVGPDGTGTIPMRVLAYTARGRDNGTLNQQIGTNEFPIPFSVDWTNGLLRLTNVQVSFGGNNRATLNLLATFGTPTLDQLARVSNWDSDQDATPDRSDNCPGTANADQTPVPSPTLELPPTATLPTCVNTGIGQATGADVCFGRPVTIRNNAPAVFPRGSSTVVWSATDSRGVSTSDQQLVIVDDRTRPTFTSVPGPIVVAACGPVALGQPAAQDDCQPPPPAVVNDAPASFPPGTTTVTWTATDVSGNAATATQTVTVNDITPPTFTFVPPAVTISQCVGANIGQARGTDSCGVTITNDAPARFPLGRTTVTWTIIDGAGNKRTAIQVVTAVLGDDASCCPVGSNVILGSSAGESIAGTGGSDCILARGGGDTVDGFGGNDFISGGAGGDTIQGGFGNDLIMGGGDNDTINGGPGDDAIDGGPGTDVCAGGGGSNQVSCEVAGP
jgi:hypothetical protein